MSTLEKKINNLEQKVLDREVEPESTSLYWEYSEAERIFFKEWWALNDRIEHVSDDYKFTAYEEAISNQAFKMVVYRFFDVFHTFFKIMIPDETERMLFMFDFATITAKHIDRKKRVKP